MMKFLQKIVDRKISGKRIFIITGIVSTIWFLVRVIPKPQRATYPCMRAVAPFMSSFFIYLISLTGSVVAFRKAREKFIEAKYLAAILLMASSVVFVGMYLKQSSRKSLAATLITGPEDGPNQPLGTAYGINPGRVVWAWNPDVTIGDPTDESIETFHFLQQYNDQDVYDDMFGQSIIKLTESSTVAESWDKLFRFHNEKKGNGDNPYSSGDKIFIKINQVTAYTIDESNGFSSFPTNAWESWKIKNIAGTQTTPYIVLSILRQLVTDAGVSQSDIYIGDPMGHIFSHNYDAWSAEFPNVHYVDKNTTNYGRTKTNPSSNNLISYSDKGSVMPEAIRDKLYDVYEMADYVINVANLKAHMRNGITGNAKNHFGSHTRNGASHLHPALIAPEEGDGTDGAKPGNITNSGYGKYRVLVDIMGNKYLGGNTLLYVIDGIYGSGYHDQLKPEKWKSYPFNNDWCNSLLMSQDPVAIESVCYDFLRTEFNGINQGVHQSPNWNGVDDYLHQAADKANWPNGIAYAPNGDDVEIGSLGVHEHWNNSTAKQYTKNLHPESDAQVGIELVSIPDTLVKYGATTSIDISNSNTENVGGIRIYPSPVRESATISFNLNEDSYISVDIYDMNGRLIEKIATKEFMVTGRHELTWNPAQSNIKTGNYICRIRTGDSIYNKKISIIKN